MSQISIIVPIFNAGKKLNKCIRSIVSQTLTDIEIILVNDGSTDQTSSICHYFAKKDKRIRVLNLQKNVGSIAARKVGINFATSDFIMFVDADDWIHRRMAEKLYMEADAHKLDITVCNMYRVLGWSGTIKRKNKSSYFSRDRIYEEDEIKNYLAAAYLHGHPFPSSLCSKLYKKDLLKDSGMFLKNIIFFGDDLFLNLEVFLKARKVKVIDEALYYYRMGGFTSKYMSSLYVDTINTYKIQRRVIYQYFTESAQDHYNGISVMLLNTFKACLTNLFKSRYKDDEISEIIKEYISDISLIESTYNEYAIKYFDQEYLDAIKNENINYLMQLGYKNYLKNKSKSILRHLVANFI
ncbi:glycosyltransferase family 2 protein [Fictibacillus enclensis]|uniref:glycosyltransferase family 2 protein n=1 Tax=Fictibacillus enclensis TaxID=1017270 RepID=UPI0024C0564A|nr:glycosyltransferase family 2 protein [Fictibacillus enclensis]WHY71035.1 glycosyltransferase family 2 protein [Fictibacillus enclensis]